MKFKKCHRRGVMSNGYNDVMAAHDENVGKMLKKLDDLGIADNTIVIYSTDTRFARPVEKIVIGKQ